MLLGTRRPAAELPSGVDTVHNYYENLVIDQLLRGNERCQGDRDFLADVACVALNRLPPRYIRHNVDMTFFMSAREMQEVHDRVIKAVDEALAYITGREAERRQAREEQPS